MVNSLNWDNIIEHEKNAVGWMGTSLHFPSTMQQMAKTITITKTKSISIRISISKSKSKSKRSLSDWAYDFSSMM